MNINQNADEFYEIVNELLEYEDVRRLQDFTQHCNTNRLQHCMNVAYSSYSICKKLDLDFRSAARAGLLHDLFLYDWRQEKQPEGSHAFAHPKVALRNARNITKLNEMEEDAIVNHMWPVTPTMPRYMESMIVSWADKYCACSEVADQTFYKIKQNWGFMKSVLFGGVYAK